MSKKLRQDLLNAHLQSRLGSQAVGLEIESVTVELRCADCNKLYAKVSRGAEVTRMKYPDGVDVFGCCFECAEDRKQRDPDAIYQ